jgi:hypothetical protein
MSVDEKGNETSRKKDFAHRTSKTLKGILVETEVHIFTKICVCRAK